MENAKSIIVAGIIILIIIAGGIFFYGRSSLKNTAKNLPVTGNTTQKNASSTQQVASGEQDITLTKEGFSPNMVAVKVGTLVKWVNTSGGIGDVDSDPH